jgi:hypothetical protein
MAILGGSMPGKHIAVGAVLVLLGPLAAWGQARTKTAVVPAEGGAPAPLAERVTAGVAAAAAAAGRDVVRTAVPLEEVRLTVDCPEPTPACTAVAARNLGVAEVLQVRLTRAGTGWWAEATLFDVAGARVARRAMRNFQGEPSADEIRQLGQEVFAAGAAPGPRHTWRLQLRPRTWIAAAAGAGLLVVGGVLGILTLTTQKDFDGMTDPVPGDPVGVRRFVDLADKGKSYATSATVFLALGGATLAVSAVFFYRDWRKVEIQPVAGPGVAGLALRRSF